jgi:hypothetical protein
MTKETIEVTAEVIEDKAITPAKDIKVEYIPSLIEDNIEAVAAYVDEQLAPFIGAQLDPNNADQVKEARSFMADLNKLKKPIEDERKRIKREYEKPLKDFEARVKGITGKIDAARDNLKKQVDEADMAFRENRRAVLVEEYECCAGVLAEVITADAMIEDSWLNRSTTEVKAVNQLTAKTVKALQGYETLIKKELSHRTEVVQLYCQTLDMVQALQLEDELVEKDRQRQEFEERQRQVAAFAAERREQAAEIEEEAFAPEPEPTAPAEPEQKPQEKPKFEVFTWSLEMRFTGTKAYAQGVADMLKSNGIKGATIKCEGVVNG